MKSITFTIALFILSFINLYSDDYTRFNDSTKTLEIINYDDNFKSNLPLYERIQFSLLDSNLRFKLADTLSKLIFYNYNDFRFRFLKNNSNGMYNEFNSKCDNKLLIYKINILNKTNQTVNLICFEKYFQKKFNPCFYIYTNNKFIQQVNLNKNNLSSSFKFNGINFPLNIAPNQNIEIYYIENIEDAWFDPNYRPEIQSYYKFSFDRNLFVFKSTIFIFPFFILIIVIIFAFILKDRIYWYYSYYLFALTFIFLYITKLHALILNIDISNFISSTFQIHILGLFLYSSVLLFLNEYLNIKNYYRKWSIFIKSIAYVSIFSLLLTFFKIPIIANNLILLNPKIDIYIYQLQGLTAAISFVCFIFLSISIYVISIKIFNKGNKNVLFIIIGWSFVISFYVIYVILMTDTFFFKEALKDYLDNHLDESTVQFYFYFGIFFEMFVFLFAIAKKTRQGQIDLAKEETERLLQEQEKKLILEAHKQLTAKNEEILSSMRYAGHLQSVVLPLEEKIQNTLPNNFIIFKPKDIVSGDFYWYADTDNFTFIGLGDCTGHGIPGSMLTMIGTMLLDQAVIQNNIYEIDQIIKFVNIQFIKSVNESKKTRDGMELAIIKIYKNSNKIEYSGLGINLYIISDEKLNEYKAKRASIGEVLDEIEVVEIDLNKNDKIYLFSDGYADQNNSDGKKYGKTKLIELITNSSNKSIKEQKNIIESELEKHKGTELQRDDVTIIGIEI